MTTLPASGYWENNARTEGEGKQWGEDVRDVIAELPGGSAAAMITIASGVIIPTLDSHTVEGEGSVSDDLTNITTTNIPDGRFLFLTVYNIAHVITIKYAAGGAGQIYLNGSADVDLDASTQWIMLKRVGADWRELFRSNHGSLHERGSDAEIDGDHLEIDLTPTYYIPSTTPAEAAHVDDLAAHLYGIDQMIGWFARGYAQRSKFTYNGGTVAYTIKCEPAVYLCKDKLCQWITELTTTAIGTPAANDFYYLYLDYSEIVSGTAIIASKLIWSATPPIWNDIYMGWYSGDDRCIMAVLTNSGPTNILEFFHDGDLVLYATYIIEANNVNYNTTWVDVDCATSMPSFSTKADVGVRTVYVDGVAGAYWRTNGQTDATGHFITSVAVGVTESMFHGPVITDLNQIVELKHSGTNGNTSYLYVHGWYFPIGM